MNSADFVCVSLSPLSSNASHHLLLLEWGLVLACFDEKDDENLYYDFCLDTVIEMFWFNKQGEK